MLIIIKILKSKKLKKIGFRFSSPNQTENRNRIENCIFKKIKTELNFQFWFDSVG